MINEQKLIERARRWCDEQAHTHMKSTAIGEAGVIATMSAYQRGMYSGVQLIEKFIADILKDEEEDDE